MSTDLGTYKGLPITGHTLKLVNAGDGLSKAMRVSPTNADVGEEVDLLVRVKAGNEIHKIDDIDHPSAWTLERAFVAQTITIVSRDFADDRIAQQLLAEAKLKEDDERKRGIHKLPGAGIGDKGDLVHVDENGVLLTAAEVAERRGDGRPVFEQGPLAPVVVVFDDGSRLGWPDEYGKGDPRPRRGDTHPDTDAVVDHLLDHDTGEVIVETAADDVAAAAFFGASTEQTEGGDDHALSTEVGAGDDFEFPDPIEVTEQDIADVDTSIVGVRTLIAEITDVGRLRRMAKAEQGRGKGAEPRSKVITEIGGRIIELERAGRS